MSKIIASAFPYSLFYLLIFTACSQIQPIAPQLNHLSSENLTEEEKQELTQIFNAAAEEEMSKEEDHGNEIEQLLQEETQQVGIHLPDSQHFIHIVRNPSVEFWIDYFTKKERARFQRFISNGEKYRAEIEKIFIEQNLPRELFFVGLIESGYYLKARSHASAVGPWQFIHGTGKRYGLIISQNLDERNDLYKSTLAAAKYFKDLYKIFGNWELALSGYNAGEFRILRKIKKSKITDYHQLAQNGHLPKETAQYVPKIIASMIIYNNLDHYGFKLPQMNNPFANTKSIALQYSLPISLIEKKFNLKSGELKQLNPELISQQTPFFKKKSYLLRLPAHKVNNNPKTVAQLKTMRAQVSYRRTVATQQHHYIVKKGDTLSQIARGARTSVAELKRMNKLSSNKIRIGQQLTLPVKNAKIHIVRRGDNLYKIAKNYGKTTRELIVTNNLNYKGTIYPGQKLTITQ